MKKIFKRSLFVAGLFLATSLPTFAQDPGPDPGGDPDAPIDGGIAILAAAGIAYGVKTLRSTKEENA